jgi:hypothetical protein
MKLREYRRRKSRKGKTLIAPPCGLKSRSRMLRLGTAIALKEGIKMHNVLGVAITLHESQACIQSPLALLNLKIPEAAPYYNLPLLWCERG